jgi:quercetin dioxygenase-like cupin family protein
LHAADGAVSGQPSRITAIESSKLTKGNCAAEREGEEGMKRTTLQLRGCAVGVLLLLTGAMGAMAQDPVVVNAGIVQVKLENSRVRVFEAVLEPGQREQLHSHPSTVVHVIAGGSIRNHSADGKTTESEFVTGDAVYRDPLTHWAENIGATTIRVLVVELKDQP